MTCIIVGGGAAGFQAAMTCRAVWPDKAVTLIDAENEAGYYRTPAAPVHGRGAPGGEALLPAGGNDPLLTVRTGVRGKDPWIVGSPRLSLDSGEALPYDRLILAHGGDPHPARHPRRSALPAGSFPSAI